MPAEAYRASFRDGLVVGLSLALLLCSCGGDDSDATTLVSMPDDTSASEPDSTSDSDAVAPPEDVQPPPSDLVDVTEPADATEVANLPDLPDTPAPADLPDVADVPEAPDLPDGVQPEDIAPPEDDADVVEPPPSPCDSLRPLPLPWTKVGNLGGAEDFCLDDEGNLYLVKGGTLRRREPDGTITIIAPVSPPTAGTGCLSDGRVVIASGDTLVVVDPSTGGYETILAGLQYPNGLDIDFDDTIFVAEQSGGRLRAVDPDTGEFEVLAEGLPSPNGVSFSPGYVRVYVGSFGGGKVHGLSRLPDGTWGKAWLLAQIKKDETKVIDEPLLASPTESDYDPCGAVEPGASCVTPDGWDGHCVETEWGPLCHRAEGATAPGIAACEGKTDGAACALSILGQPFKGLCLTPASGPACCDPKAEKGCSNDTCETCVCDADTFCCNNKWDNGCAKRAKGACSKECGCPFGGVLGGTGVEPLACYAHFDALGPCAGKSAGAKCELLWDHKSVFPGKCTNLASAPQPLPYPESGIGCVSDKLYKGGGGLDGLNVDECGNVYVTEYQFGYVWRIDPDGGIAKVVKLPSSWIPNMEFGRGLGGYDATSLHVTPINGNYLYALPVGLHGKEITAPPAP